MRYSLLVKSYDALDKTTKRLEKTKLLFDLIKETPKDEIKLVIYLLQGRVFPKWDERKIGMSSQLTVRSLELITGISKNKIEDLWKKEGDLGKVSEIIIKEKTQRTLGSKELTVRKVFENIRKLAELQGQGTVDRKVKLVAELLSSAKPKEARFVVRTVLDNLRIGVKEGILRDALAWTIFPVKYIAEENKIEFVKGTREDYNLVLDKVQHAYNLTNDFGTVAESIKKNGLKELDEVSIDLGKPINSMLAIKEESIKDALKAVGSPALFDYKLDGFRLQIHKSKGKYTFFTRRLENVTKQFKELIPILDEHVKGDNYILDSELVGYDFKTRVYLPFQSISQRIKRKHNIDKTAKDFPVEINIFDVLYYKNKNYMNKSQKERRKLIEEIVKQKKLKIVLTKKLVSGDLKKIESFYQDALSKGYEGLIAKNLEKNYTPGRKVGGWVKLKPVMEPLQLVVIGAEWGEGKRANWLSSFILACKKENKFLEIGKVGTGIKEKGEGLTFKELTKLFKPLIEKEEGKHVTIKPKILIDVSYEEIQRSPKYSSGYALRFPRLTRLRDDLSLKDCDNIKRVENIYKKQKK